jgi:hypothetical protein
MNTYITIYHNLKSIVTDIFSSLSLSDRTRPKGRKPAIGNIEAVTLALLARRQNVATKKALYEIMEPSCSYNTFVRTLNRSLGQLAFVAGAIMRLFEKDAHPVKHTDSTDVPVCLVKNGKSHRTMRGFAQWSKTGKGWFFGLKLHLSSDLRGRVLALRLTPGNSDDRCIFRKMNDKLRGIFIADAGYISKDVERGFFIEHERMILTIPRANMRRIATAAHIALMRTRMRVEIHFRVLTCFFGLVTSLPRSVDGYLAHYLSAICAYLVA